jgi:predicted O-methyltransferase YrrM
MIKEIEEKIIIPPKERIVSISVEEASFIHEFVRKLSIKRTLEIGFAYGYSAAYIISATGCKHVVIDPNQKEYQNLGIRNLEALGLQDRYELQEQPSYLALPELLKEGKTFEFGFIDGCHKFDDIFVDWYYSDLLLEKGGYLLFHDSWMRSTQVVTDFVRTNRADYREHMTPLKNLLLFQKSDRKDERRWDHFEEFCPPDAVKIFDRLKTKLWRRICRGS